MTRDGTTLTIDVFVLVPMLAILAGLALILWQSTRQTPPKDSTDDATTFSIRALLAPIPLPDRIKLAGFGLWATLFATLGAGVFFAVITALIALPSAGEDTGFNLLRGALITVAAITATLGAVVALPFTIRRSIQAERQTRTAEEGYITQQINEAVANLAAQKEVNKVGRVISYQPANPDERWFTTYETVDDRHRVAPEIDGSTIKKSAWEPVKITEPNIEVRIGAILALERLARQRAVSAVREMQTALETEPEWRRSATEKVEQVPRSEKASVLADELSRLRHRTTDGVLNHDGARDHMRIMEILTAYIRENAPGSAAADRPSQEEQTDTDLRNWASSLKREGLSTDISTLMRVLGRRTPEQRICEGLLSPEPHVRIPQRQKLVWHGKRLDLSSNNYQGADLTHSEARPVDLAYVDFTNGRIEGALLSGAHLEGANLFEAQMEAANLSKAKMKGANLSGARIETTDLKETRMENTVLFLTQMKAAYLRDARMEGAVLYGAQMEGANLSGAQMEGAILCGALFDKATEFRPITLRAAGLKNVDLSMLTVDPDRLAEAFGDATVILPDNLAAGKAPLAHWSTEDLEYKFWDEGNSPFHIAWRAFQKDIGYEPRDRG